MTVMERFLDYITWSTQSEADVEAVPSTERQWGLAKHLKEECEAMGLANVRLSDHCYVYVELPATPGCESVPAIGFIAHMDTATEISGENVKAQVIENYDGGAVALGESGLVLDPAAFPHLKGMAGKTLITTDGTTLLGADDKAGIAEILTMAETLIREGRPHGKICIGFTPDEEVGNGPAFFDIEGFGADYAYTVDGGDPSTINYENFNAVQAVFLIKGFNIHPGSAKDKMINALLVGYEINSMLPSGETPRDTEGREGFYHLIGMEGDTAACTLTYIVRDFDAGSMEARRNTLRHITDLLNTKYGAGTVTLSLKDQYPNMIEGLRDKMFIVEDAFAAIDACGLTHAAEPARGGTDGATLTIMGLPCPNLGSGENAAHGPYEHITKEDLELCTEILLTIVGRAADRA